ncbi:MAG: serine hydrolase domain-containing protein [Caldilineaceae bacterium]
MVATAQPTGFDPKLIDAFVRQQVERHGLPGLALAVVNGDQIVQLQGYGKADPSGRPITPQTPFVLASASKPLTALAVMQLVEAGKVELDAPVQRYIPEFRVAATKGQPSASQQITVRHLLQHTSGIPEVGCQSNRFDAKTLAEFVTALQTIELDAPVGARHFYCSGNYNILGYLIERVSGQSYAVYMQQHLFTPLAMQHSFTEESPAKLAGLAQGYHWLFGVPMPAQVPYEAAQMPSGFLIASAEDLAHFLIAQLNGGRFGITQILSPQGIAAMHAPGVPVGDSQDTYGLGWRTTNLGGVPVIAHSGDHPDVHTLIFMELEHRRGAVLLLNSQNMLAQFGAYREIEAGIARLLAEQKPMSATALRLPTLYLVLDGVLGALLLLALCSFLRLPRWTKQLQQRQAAGQLRLRWVNLRLFWELGFPIVLLVSARLLLHLLGAQSWAEGLLLFPDLGAWLWVFAALLLLTGGLRLINLRRVLRHAGGLVGANANSDVDWVDSHTQGDARGLI